MYTYTLSNGFNSILQITNILKEIFPNLKISWNSKKPTGDKIRVMSNKLMLEYGLKSETSLFDAINQTVSWYKNNQDLYLKRYNSFNE